MKEQLYAIPVNDAFNADCECPVCAMYKTLEDNAIEYTMGPSYMEDDTRALTDRKGFCKRHMEMIYTSGNKLGIALIMKTHFDKTIKDITPLAQTPAPKKSLFAKKDSASTPLIDYLNTLNTSCFVCDRINNVFNRYIDTIYHLYKNDTSFVSKYENCKGFCNEHYKILIENAPNRLSGNTLTQFTETTNTLYLRNMERVRDDLAWFIDKFDYRNEKEPWKNSKDSIPRAIIKSNSLIL